MDVTVQAPTSGHVRGGMAFGVGSGNGEHAVTSTRFLHWLLAKGVTEDDREEMDTVSLLCVCVCVCVLVILPLFPPAALYRSVSPARAFCLHCTSYVQTLEYKGTYTGTYTGTYGGTWPSQVVGR